MIRTGPTQASGPAFREPQLPEFLTALKGWVVWRLVKFEGEKKFRKVPHYVNGSMRKNHGTDEDRAQLATFAQACATARAGGYNGLGLAILPDFGVVALDFDDVVQAGEVDPRVEAIVEGTYAEFSPSGTGVRAFYRGSLLSRKDNEDNLGTKRAEDPDYYEVEFFGTSGFVTVTGDVLPSASLFGYDEDVIALTDSARELYVERFGAVQSASSGGADDGDWLLTLTPKIGMDIAEARRTLAVVTPICGYQDWLGTGQALHHEFDGSDEARELYREWSKGDLLPETVDRTGFEPATDKLIDGKWRSFGRYTGAPRSMAWVLKMAKENRTSQRYDAVAAYRAQITGAADEFTLRETVATRIAQDERLGDFEREALAQALLDAFKSKGAKYPVAAMRKLVAAKRVRTEARLDLQRDGAGRALATKENLRRALSEPAMCGVQVAHDEFRDETMLARAGTAEWRAITDNDIFGLGLMLEQGEGQFVDIPKERQRDAVLFVADQCKFDSAKLWLDSLSWDGEARVTGFLTHYFGAADTPYIRAVSTYLWTALAGRVMQPGVKADMVPTAVGAQGVGKTRSIAALAPAPEFFGELDLGSKDDDIGRLLRGKLVVELGELKGLRSRERESLKAFITRTHEEWVPKFREFATKYPRRCVFFGSTNREDFLVDDTGNRRWLPFNAGQCNPDGITLVRDQLWAEGRELFAANGVLWQDAQRLAEAEHEKFAEADAWTERVDEWLNATSPFDDEHRAPGNGPVTSEQALQCALGLSVKEMTKANKDRMAAVLKSLGLVKIRARLKGKGRPWVYVMSDRVDQVA